MLKLYRFLTKLLFEIFLSYIEIQENFSKLLYNFNKRNFEKFVLILAKYKNEKNANYSKRRLVMFFIACSDTQKHVFVKLTTTKLIAKNLYADIKYSSYKPFDAYKKIYNIIVQYRSNSNLCKN